MYFLILDYAYYAFSSNLTKVFFFHSFSISADNEQISQQQVLSEKMEVGRIDSRIFRLLANSANHKTATYSWFNTFIIQTMIQLVIEEASLVTNSKSYWGIFSHVETSSKKEGEGEIYHLKRHPHIFFLFNGTGCRKFIWKES